MKRLLVLLAAAALGWGCGRVAPGERPAVRAALQAAEEARRRGDLEVAARGFREAAGLAAGGFEVGTRARALGLLAGVEADRGRLLEARVRADEAAGLLPRDPGAARRVAELALLDGRGLDAALARIEGLDGVEDEALRRRLRLRRGEEVGAVEPGGGIHSLLLSSERAGVGEAVRLLRAALPTLEGEDLARAEEELAHRELEGGGSPTVPAHLPPRARRMLELHARLREAAPDSPGDLFADLRRRPLLHPDIRVRVLSRVAPGPPPFDGEVPEELDRSRLVDRDPSSPRRRADGLPRLVVVELPGLSLEVLGLALRAPGFPRLRAHADRALFVRVEPGQGAADLRPSPVPPAGGWLEVRGAGASPELAAARAAGVRDRLRRRGLPDPVPRRLVEDLVAAEVQLRLRLDRFVEATLECRHRVSRLELPAIGSLLRRLLPLREPGPARELLVPDPGALERGALDLLAHLERLLDRLAPLGDLDDHLAVVSARGPGGGAGVALVSGPRVRSGLQGEALGPGTVAGLLGWLASGADAAPRSLAALVRAASPSPFAAGRD